MPVLPPRVSGPDWMVRGQFRPRHQVRGGGEAAHVQPDLGDDHLCVVFADSGDLVEPLDRGESRAFGQGVGSHADRVTGGWAVAAGVDGLGLGHRRQQLFDAGGERVDLGGERVDLVQ